MHFSSHAGQWVFQLCTTLQYLLFSFLPFYSTRQLSDPKKTTGYPKRAAGGSNNSSNTKSANCWMAANILLHCKTDEGTSKNLTKQQANKKSIQPSDKALWTSVGRWSPSASASRWPQAGNTTARPLQNLVENWPGQLKNWDTGSNEEIQSNSNQSSPEIQEETVRNFYDSNQYIYLSGGDSKVCSGLCESVTHLSKKRK